MAIMFPESVDTFTTEGERRVYHFLRYVARPDTEFMVWYEPDIRGREPDFIVFSPECGLIVLEVKDWRIDQILEADPKSFRMQLGRKEDVRKNPLAQAKEYVKELMGRLNREWSGGNARSKPPFPISEGVVFSHITRADFFAARLDHVIPDKKVIFWDDMHEQSPLWSDPSGQTFRKWIREHFPPLFPFAATAADMLRLRKTLFPVVRIDVPQRGGAFFSDTDEHIAALDQCQEQLARNFCSGKRLISGPSGSGKTLILAHQAWHLPRVNKHITKILFTCFNLSLSGYIRRLLARKHVAMGADAVEIVPIYDLCERILGERLAHAKEQSDYYELVVAEALELLCAKKSSLAGSWDAILVDEGQDFTPEMARLLDALLRPDHGVLTVALDENQSIYSAEHAWSHIGGMGVTRLRRQYRSARQIVRVASRLLDKQVPDDALCGPTGLNPVFMRFDGQQNLLQGVVDAIDKRVQQGVPMSDIAVLYLNSKLKSGGLLPLRLIELLELRGVLADWPAEDERAKRRFDITADTVKICTVHSVKGMDFSSVFIIGLDDLVDHPNGKNRRLAYAGLTRARHELIIVHVGNDGLMPLLLSPRI